MKKPTLKQLQQQIADLTEALQRERADAMNVKRRAEEDKARMGDFYKVMIMRELLPALDNLERGLKFSSVGNFHVPKHASTEERELFNKSLNTLKQYEQGIQGVNKQFEDSFAKLGIEHVKTVGEPFDPKLHEAVSVEGDGPGVEIVCEELQPGYKMGEEIIRHALVKVKMEKK